MDFLYTPNSIVNTQKLLLVIPTDNQNALILFDNGERVHVSNENAKLLVDAVRSSASANSGGFSSQTGMS